MALEYVFKMFLYVVAILVVIGLIINFRESILSALNLCDYLPSGCPSKEKCETIRVAEQQIDENILNKYCGFCWSRTGEKNYEKDCICYIVSGSFSPITYSNQNCELKCKKDATSLIFTYSNLLKKIFVEC